MSSGGIVLAPVAVPVVAAGAVVLVGAVVIAAGAVLVARAANAAIEGAVRAVGDYGENLEQRVAGMEAAAAAALRWEVAAADVVAVNARLRLLRGRAAAAGVAVEVPSPLKLTSSRSPAELGRWAAAAQRELARTQETLDALLPPPRLSVVFQASKADTELAAALTGHREALRRRYSEAIAVLPAPVSPGTVEQVLALLDPDATTDERAEVLSAAALVLVNRHEQDTYLTALRQLVIADINPKVARRRVAAGWVQVLDDGPLTEVLASIEPPVELAGTVERLRAVLTGAQDLTEELRADGARLMDWAEETARQVFVRELVRHCLTEQGYQVEETFDVRNSVGLRLRRTDWEREHTAEVWVDKNTTVHGKLVREIPALGDDARLKDRSRCDSFADALEGVAGRIADSDARTTVVVDRDQALEHRTSETGGSTVPVNQPKYREK